MCLLTVALGITFVRICEAHDSYIDVCIGEQRVRVTKHAENHPSEVYEKQEIHHFRPMERVESKKLCDRHADLVILTTKNLVHVRILIGSKRLVAAGHWTIGQQIGSRLICPGEH